jgi:hypothetical protein
MKAVLAIALVCLTAVAISVIMSNYQVSMYNEFNKQFLAAQVLEIELQNRYEDQNITIDVYEPPVGFL